MSAFLVGVWPPFFENGADSVTVNWPIDDADSRLETQGTKWLHRKFFDGNVSPQFSNGRLFRVSESGIGYSPQFARGQPQSTSEKADHQSKKGGDGLPIRFKEFARADLSPSQRNEDLGNTFFRLVIGALVIGLVHALLKCIGKPNDRSRHGYGQKGEKP